jgi:EmrB/QacA subfamily drug resistance transporter
MGNITKSQKKWTLGAAIIGSGMAFINGSVVNVALPAIQTALDGSVSDMQWVISIYTFILSPLILVGGSAGDYFGRKRVFGWGIFLFLLATVWCGLSPNVIQLIIARCGQALGGALMIPGSLALITEVYNQNERGKAIGTWSAATALATAVGPLLGGVLVDQLSWRFIFLISVPLAITALVILYSRVPVTNIPNRSENPDWKGALLATMALGLICYSLIEASNLGLKNHFVIIAFIVGVVLIAFFIWIEKRAENPIMPLKLFRSTTFSGANAVTISLYFSLAGGFFLLPFNLIQVQSYSATAVGAALLPFPLLVGVLSRWSGGLITQWGARPLLVLGPLLAAIGFVLLGIFGTTRFYWTSFFPGICIMGLGIAISFAPLNTTVMSSVEKLDVGKASGVNNAIARLSGMLAVALLGALAIGLFGNQLSVLMNDREIPKKVQQQVLDQQADLAKAEVPGSVAPEMRQILQRQIHQAFLYSFRVVMYISAGLVILGAICAALTIDYKPESSNVEADPIPD